MASEQDGQEQDGQEQDGQEQVELSPEDIPGASVSAEQIGKLTVSQLKFWLKCRRINQSGNKKELLERYVVILGILRLSLFINNQPVLAIFMTY